MRLEATELLLDREALRLRWGVNRPVSAGPIGLRPFGGRKRDVDEGKSVSVNDVGVVMVATAYYNFNTTIPSLMMPHLPRVD